MNFSKSGVFHLDGYGHSHDDAMPRFFPDSMNSMIGFFNEESFVSEFFGNVAKVHTSYWEAQNKWFEIHVPLALPSKNLLA